MTYAVTRAALNTSTGTQDITVSGFGTPTAALFILTEATTDGTATANLSGSIGVTDGSTHSLIAFRSADGLATSNTDRRRAQDEIAMLVDNSGAVVLEANFDSWVTDGVRVNLTVTDGTAYLLTVVLFGASAAVGNISALGTSGNTVTETPGFQLSALLFFSIGGATTDDTAAIPAVMLGGFASFDGSTVLQNSYAWFSQTSSASGDPRARVRNDAVMSSVGNTNHVTLGNITSTQFDLTSTGDLSNLSAFYLALGGIDAWSGMLDSPTATGDNAWTGVGFQPEFGLLMPTMMTALNTQKTNAEAGAFGFAALDGSSEYCAAWADEDAAGTTNTQSLSDNQAVNLDTDAGAAAFDATFKSFDSDGATLTFTAADGTARKWPALFMADIAAASTIPVFDHHYRAMRVA